jgi:hypothetical protein
MLVGQPATAGGTHGDQHGHHHPNPHPHPGGGGQQPGKVINFQEPGAPQFKVLAQDQPSDCFVAIGVQHIPINPDRTCSQGKATTTQDYMWGFTTAEDQKSLWFGTGTATLCGNLSSYDPELAGLNLGTIPPFQTDEAVCEFDQSYNSQKYNLGIFGDTTPPKIYQYLIGSHQLIDRTPNDPAIESIGTVGGWRSAGTHNGVVFMAGIEAQIGGGTASGGFVHLAAFSAKTGAYLGQREYDEYNNPKGFFNDGDALYLGVNLTNPEGPNGEYGGKILKWTGNIANPFRWQVVGEIPGQPAYFARYENRIVVSTWTSTPDPDAGIYVSPIVPRGSTLNAGDIHSWKKVFGVDQFFPDPITAKAFLGGGMGKLGGWLYWGVMDYPGTGTLGHKTAYPQLAPKTPAQWYQLYLRSDPAAHVFRVKHLGQPDQKIQLLYGESRYPVFDPNLGANGRWVSRPNLLHQRPLFGSQGFGNRWQPYSSWGITKYDGKLVIGGFDSSKLFRDLVFNPQTNIMSKILDVSVDPAQLRGIGNAIWPNRYKDGGDSWIFDNANSPARKLTTTGFGNPENWGNRDFFVAGSKLYAGTNNGWNWAAPNAQPAERPGWQLLQFDNLNPTRR